MSSKLTHEESTALFNEYNRITKEARQVCTMQMEPVYTAPLCAYSGRWGERVIKRIKLRRYVRKTCRECSLYKGCPIQKLFRLF